MDDFSSIKMNDACLWVDIYCYICKKLMALSNAIQFDGRYYCHNCDPNDYSMLNL